MPLESYLLIHQDAKLTPEQNKNYRRISFPSKVTAMMNNLTDEQLKIKEE